MLAPGETIELSIVGRRSGYRLANCLERFPAGSLIIAELRKSLDAKKSKIGDVVEVKSTAALIVSGHIALPAGTRIEGLVVNIRMKGKDSPGSMVEITFDRALANDGHELPLQARYVPL